MDSANFKTFRAIEKLCDITPLGDFCVGNVLLTIDFGNLNEQSLSANFYLKDIIEVDNLPTFSIMDFPDTAELPPIDIQDTSSSSVSSVPASIPCETDVPAIDLIDEHAFDFPLFNYPDIHAEDEHSVMRPTIEMDSSDFVALPDDDEGLDLQIFEEEALLEDINAYENKFFPINHPSARAGVQVNRKGEIILLSDDEEALKTLRIRQMDHSFVKVPQANNNLHLISKVNKAKVGPVFAFDVYRNGIWLIACDIHLPTEIIKTFLPQFQKHQIEIIHLDGNNSNCHIHNLVPFELKQIKLWHGELLPNHYCSFDGKIALIKEDKVILKKIGSKQTCYIVNMGGVQMDARKVIWRTFTDEDPEYSMEHYRVHIIDKTKADALSFDNLMMSMESSTFSQWTNEKQTWPWKRSSQGNVPKHLRVKTKNKTKEAVNKAKPKRQQRNQAKVKTPVPPTPTSTASLHKNTPTSSVQSCKKRASPVKQVLAKKKVRLMSQTKFDELRLKVQMNLTCTKKERETFAEQRVLRKLKRFLG